MRWPVGVRRDYSAVVERGSEDRNRAVQEIVLAAIVDGRNRLLVQPRVGDAELAGTWELPGGKVEPEEDHAAALVREVEEETGIAIEVGELAVALCHDYPDRRVALHAYLCRPLRPVAPVRWARWAAPDEIARLPMPEANAGLLAAIRFLLDSDSTKSYK